jgi:RNA polymerase sigma factor (sigma-70 family)
MALHQRKTQIRAEGVGPRWYAVAPSPGADGAEGGRAESDRDLILQVRAGDLDAYGALFERHHRTAWRNARRTLDSATADDVVAEAFVNVLRLLLQGRGPSEFFLPYLLRVVRNKTIDAWRRRPDLPVADLVSGTLLWGGQCVDPADQVSAAMVARQAMMSLPPRWRLVLWLLEVEGHDRHTVGAMMGLRPDAVSSLSLRARKGLRLAYLALESRQEEALLAFGGPTTRSADRCHQAEGRRHDER